MPQSIKGQAGAYRLGLLLTTTSSSINCN